MNRPSDSDMPTEMTLEDALAYATRLHRIGEIDAAETLYKRVLEAVPEHPDALGFLAIARHQRGFSEEAIELLRRSSELRPNAPGVWINLGNILLDLGRFELAGEAYEHSLQFDDSNPGLYSNLGVLRRAQGRLDEAEAAYRRALELDRKDIDAHNNLGNLLAGTGRIEEAVKHYCESIALMPSNPAARKMLGYAYCMLGRIDEAVQYYRAWLREEPDNATARHHLAACSGEDVPERATDGYVESVFDSFAESFDAKLSALTYRAPELIAEAVARRFGDAAHELDILDAGCGTGLCGPLLSPHARTLTGIDLSQPMLAKAQGRRSYDRLIKAEITSFLETSVQASYDLIVSADTLCYFGALKAVLAAARHSLRSPGSLIFTVEMTSEDAAPETGYRLATNGRYQHSRQYVCAMLQAAGFATTTTEEVVLRTEGGKPVAGLLVSADTDPPPGH